MSEQVAFRDSRLAVFCCGRLFRRARQAKLVGRPSGGWQFMCGETDHLDPQEPYHVSVGVLLDLDPTPNNIADLPPDWEAERVEYGSPSLFSEQRLPWRARRMLAWSEDCPRSPAAGLI